MVLSGDTQGSSRGAIHRGRAPSKQGVVATAVYRLRTRNGREMGWKYVGGMPPYVSVPPARTPEIDRNKLLNSYKTFPYVSPHFPSSVLCLTHAGQQAWDRRGAESGLRGRAVVGQRRRTPGDWLLLCRCASARGSKSIDLLALRARAPNLPPSASLGSAQIPVRYRHKAR